MRTDLKVCPPSCGGGISGRVAVVALEVGETTVELTDILAKGTELTAAPDGVDIRLAWRNEPSKAHKGYELWRWSEPAGWSPVSLPTDDATEHTDRGLVLGVTYWYYLADVSMTDDLVRSSRWTSVSWTAGAPKSPTNLTVEPLADGFRLGWVGDTANETVHELWRWSEKQGLVSLGRLPANARSYDDRQSLTPGTTYWYYVAAFNKWGYSGWAVSAAVSLPQSAGFELTISGAAVSAGQESVSLPGGAVSVSPPPNSPNGRYTPGTRVTLTATAATGFTFQGWSGDCALSAAASACTLVMDSARTPTATFTAAKSSPEPPVVDPGPGGTGR